MYSRSRLKKLLTVVPEFTSILVSSPDHEVARERLLAETRHMIEENDDELMLVTGLQFSLRLNCARAFRQFLSRRSARVSGFDLVKVLFDLANTNTQTLPVDLSDAFLEDLYHIFAGMIGKAGVYEPIIKTRKKGRAAALIRSQALNKLCALSDKTMSRYRCGLEDSVVKVREGNRQRIMSYFNCSEAEFADYRWQLQHIIRDSDTLGRLIELTDSEKKAIDLARKSGIPFGITPYYASLFDYSAGSPFDMPVRTQ
ncbi:MAG: KamA family radical SAM protein, partial [Candidatus Riflebacteria bacterium]|nr:KamA family radical SAM protein [Candidatus Riflebacteria bacterium]